MGHFQNGDPGILYGASFSYLVQMMMERGFYLYKMNHMDGVWVHQRVAHLFAESFVDLRFPIDERACYMEYMSTKTFRASNWTQYNTPIFLNSRAYQSNFAID